MAKTNLFKVFHSAIIFVCILGCSGKTEKQKTEAETFEWEVSSFEKEGLPSGGIDSLFQSAQEGDYGFINEILVIKEGKILFEKKINWEYDVISNGKKGKMGCGANACSDSTEIHVYNYYHPRYHPYYKDTHMHTLQSVTKSVAATIIGCAIKDGKLSSVKKKLYPYFSKHSWKSDSLKQHYQKATIEDVLTMRLGIAWKEFGMSLEDDTDVSAMERSDDWIAYVLDQPVENPPGDVWNYNSGASALLSEIIFKETGRAIDTYAENILFKPLGIKEYYWKKTEVGLPDSESGLYLKTRDLARIGQLYLQGGIWNGQRILPEDWINEATRKHAKDIYGDGGEEGYGYQWWLTAHDPPLVVALGYGNQILILLPEKKVMGIIYAWNIFDNEANYIFGDFVNVLRRL